MKYCEEYAALLDAFADGECTAEEAAKVREHLAVCPGCQSYLNEILLMKDAFPSEDVELPEGFADGILAAVRADAAPRKRTTVQWAKIWLPRVACLALAVGIGIFWMAIGGAGRSSSSGAAPAAVMDSASVAEGFAAGSADANGLPESALKSSELDESTPASSQESLDSQTALTAASPFSSDSDASAGAAGSQAAAKGYARWAAFTASEVGDTLKDYDGQTETDSVTGDAYTLYELNRDDFDSVIAALDGSDAVTADDSANSSLCAIAVYPD